MANPHGARRMWWREVVTSYPCPVCEAGPGEPCQTFTGHAKYEPHAERSRIAAEHRWRTAEGDTPDDGTSKRG